MSIESKLDRILEAGHWQVWDGKQSSLSFIVDPKSRAKNQKLVPVMKSKKKKKRPR